MTDLDRRSVVSHYARQLEQAGWKPHVEEERDAGIWGTWIYGADDMADRYGILFLSILHHPGHPPSYGAATDLTERPEIVEQYWLEVRTVWRAANGASAEAPTPSTTNNSQ